MTRPIVCHKDGTPNWNADHIQCFQKIWADLSRNKAKSKTEAMFFPPPGVSYEDADTSPILINTGADTGEIPFTPTLKLLGSTLANNGLIT